MTSTNKFDSFARAFARRASRRDAIKGGAAMATAGALVGAKLAGGSSASAQDAATITFWFDTTGGAETAQCLIDNVVAPFNDRGGLARPT